MTGVFRLHSGRYRGMLIYSALTVAASLLGATAGARGPEVGVR